jgi:hypothetical protein
VRLRTFALMSGLLWALPAHADPISAVAFLAPIIGGTAAAFLVTNAAYLFAAGVAAYNINRQRSAKRKARDSYNASLRDRLQMLDLVPDAPRTIVLGRARTVEGVRRRWSSGANSDRLTLIVSFAGHQIDGYSTFFFNDEQLTLDGSGYVLDAPYGRTRLVSKEQFVTLDGSGGASVTLSSAPAGVVTAAEGSGVGVDYTETSLTVGGSGTSRTLSGGTPGGGARIMWQTNETQSFARIREYLGTSTQNVGGDIAAEFSGQVTSADKFAGIACAVVDLWYDPDIYPQGVPNITAQIRGAKVYDPRADSTVAGGSGSQRLATPSTWTWSENPALHAYHYARLGSGWNVPAAEIRTADVMAAADACAVSTNFTLRKPDGSTSVVTMPRYRSGIVIPTDADPGAMMDEIIQAMAGKQGWAGGTWRLRAGTLGSTAWTMDASWVAQRLDADGNADTRPVVRITNGVQRDAKINTVSGTCVDRDQRYQVLPFPAVTDPVLVAAEGSYSTELEMQAVNHVAHAQHLGTVAIRESQAALRMEVTCNLSAWRLELFDVGAVTLPRYGMSGKTFEVVGWRWHPTEGVGLQLAEITAAIFTPVAELSGRDPAPNSTLPAPWDVQAITGLAITSGTSTLTDGSVITRTRVTWAAATSQAILRGGSIEVQYTPAAATLPAGDWPSWPEQGDSTEAVIPGLLSRRYVFRVRAVNALRVRGPWSAQVVHAVASSRAPKVFRQTTAPSGSVSIEGDRWFDTNDDNHPYVYTSGVWISVRDGTIQDAQATADGKVFTFVQSSAPTADGVGDLWLDSNDGNKLYRWNGAAWVALPLGTGGIQSGAATDIVSDDHDFAGAAFAGDWGTERSFTYTPNVDCTIEWTCDIQASNVLPDSGSNLGWRVTPSGGAALDLVNFNGAKLYGAKSFAAAGGVLLTFELRSRTSGGPAIVANQSYARATAIKR